MKIQKFNESNLTNDILNDFMEYIMNYFYPDESGSMGPYHAWLDKKNKNNFNVEFQFLVIDMIDLDNVLKIYNYLKSFDNKSSYMIYAENVDDEINASCFRIILSVDKFDDIYNDLKIKNNAGKYNL